MSSHINQILSCANSFIAAHVKMQNEAKEAAFRDEPLKYYKFRECCIKGSWFNDHYLSARRTSGLKNALIGLNSTDWAVHSAANLELNLYKHIQSEKEIGASKNFGRLQILFPDILDSICSQCISAKNLRIKLLAEMQTLSRLVDILEEIDEPESVVIKSSLGSQNALVEQVISEALQSVSKQVAAEIRSKLARSDNKLHLLQQLLEE